MPTAVESRTRTRFLRGGIRGLLSGSSTLQRLNDEGGQVVPTSPSTPAHAMFQDARNTSIHNSTFNIYASGSNVGSVSSYTESSSLSPPSTESSSSTLMTRSPRRTAVTDIETHPCINEPIPISQTSPEIYVHNLMRQNRGYPLWIPSPSMSLPAAYRALGVSLGDVGIITPEGGFSFFFNVLHGNTHPVNAGVHLPDRFEPYVPRGRTGALVHVESSAMTCLTSDKFMTRSCEDEKTIFQTSAKEAALLMMPEPVYLSRLHDVSRFRMYVGERIEDWYRHIRGVLGWDVDNGDLRVVYGCRNTAGFGIATITNATQDSTTELTFLIDESRTETADCKYRWHHRGSAEAKAGPLASDNADIRELDPNGGVLVNQCLFLNTIDFTLSDDQWARVESFESVPVSTNTLTPQSTPAEPLMSPHVPNKSSTESDTRHASQSNTARVNNMIALPISKKLFHPSDVLGKFLLSKVPDAKSVAICFDDWGQFMTDNVNDTNTFVRSVLQANDVFQEDGVIYLEMKSLLPLTPSAILSKEDATCTDLLGAEAFGVQSNLNKDNTQMPPLYSGITHSIADHRDVLTPPPTNVEIKLGRLPPLTSSLHPLSLNTLIDTRLRFSSMDHFINAVHVKINGGTFTSVNNSGTFVNNTNSNNTTDSFNTRSSVAYDSYNDNSKQQHGSGGNRNYNASPPPRNRPPPPAHSPHTPSYYGYGGAPGPSYGGHPGYPSPPPMNMWGPSSGGTYGSYNTSNEEYHGSFNDNSHTYGAPPPSNRGPDTRRQGPGNPSAPNTPWMEGDNDDFMNGPSRNPRTADGRSHSYGQAPYGDPSQRSPVSPPGARRGPGFADGVGLGGGRAVHIRDTHVRMPQGAHMSVQGAQIAQMGPESQRHFNAFFQSLEKEFEEDSEDSEPEADKRMKGADPSKVLSAGTGNMSLNDSGPSRMQRTRSVPTPQDPQRYEDNEMGGGAHPGASRPARSAVSADTVPQLKKKKKRAPASDEEGRSGDDQSQARYQAYSNHPGHPGASAPQAPYGGYAPQPPQGQYAAGAPYPDPRFQQRAPYGNNYGQPHPGAYGYGAQPQVGYQGSGNVHNVHMDNAFNDNSYVESHEEASSQN